MKRLWLILTVLLMVMIISCDDSTSSISEGDILGKWEMTAMKIDGTTVNPDTLDGIPVRVEFYTDGNATFFSSDMGATPVGIDIDWRISGTTLYVTFPGEAEEGVPITISANTLTINVPDWDEGVPATLIYEKSVGI